MTNCFLYIPSLDVIIYGNYPFKYLHIENLRARKEAIEKDPYIPLVAQAQCWVFITDMEPTIDMCEKFIAHPDTSFKYALDYATGHEYKNTNCDYEVLKLLPKVYGRFLEF